MLFGGAGEKKQEPEDPAIMHDDAIVAVEEPADAAIITAGEESKKQADEAIVDDAIVDDAIVFDEDDAIVKDGTPAEEKKDLTQDDIAILKAAQQKPLWHDSDRKIYT